MQYVHLMQHNIQIPTRHVAFEFGYLLRPRQVGQNLNHCYWGPLLERMESSASDGVQQV